MDEIKEEACSTESKKCCTNGIIILVVCSLLCFFLGYYFGNKSNTNINRVVGSGINRPFTPNIPRIPKGLPNVPKPRMQRPPVMPQNLPKPIPPQIRQRPVQQQPQTAHEGIGGGCSHFSGFGRIAGRPHRRADQGAQQGNRGCHQTCR